MSSTNKTTHYELPQFVENDIFNPLVDDNDAYDKIDTALYNIADAEADDAAEIVDIKGRLDTAEGKVDALETQAGNTPLTTVAQTLSAAVNELNSGEESLDGRLDIVEDDINNVSTGLKVKLEAETSARETADNVIDGKVTVINNKLKNGITNQMIFMPIANYDSEYAAGNCSVLKTINSKTVMFDSGASHSYSVIKAELEKNNIDSIDYFILSHYHLDHYGNIEDMFTDGFLTTDTVVYLPRHSTVVTQSEEAAVRAMFAGNTVIDPSSSEDLIVDGVNISFLNCDAADVAYYDSVGTDNGNSYSVCNYITMGDATIFITADIGTLAENRMLELGVVKKCDVFAIPHHSRNDSIVDLFYQTVSPEYCISFNNSYNEQLPALIQSRKIAYLNDLLKSKIYNCGNGAIYCAMWKDCYTIDSNGKELTASYFDYHSVQIYVNQSYDGDVSDGLIATPFKTLDAAINLAKTIKNAQQININIVGAYTATEEYNISDIPSLVIIGELNNDAIQVTIPAITVKNVSQFDMRNVNLNSATKNGAFSLLSTGYAILNNVVIDGDMSSVSSPASARGINANNGAIVYLVDCTISNHGYAIGCYGNAVVSAARLKGTNNKYIGGGESGNKIVIKNSTITADNYFFASTNTPVTSMKFKKDYLEVGFNQDAPYIVFRDDTMGTDAKTVTIDLSGSEYTRRVFQLRSATGAVYEFTVWGGSVSTPELIQTAYSPTADTDFAYSFTGKVLSLTYNNLAVLELVG